MHRAYAVLDVRSMNATERTIEGIASTPTPDRMGDIVEPMGAKFSIPMPLLWQHDSRQPIGQVTFAKPTKDGIPFKAQILSPDAVESPTLKDRLQMAWDSISNKLVRAVSIGFRELEYSFMDNGGIRFNSWEWLELSAVTIPANADATINVIRSIDHATLAERENQLATERAVALLDGAAALLTGLISKAESDDGAAPGQDADADDRSKAHVVKLQTPARARAPFVINRINHG
jgi:HK97 family phage prohead protease